MRKALRRLLLGIPGVTLGGGGGEPAFVGPYDAIPSITAAYGMRRLRSAYTGNVLRLRRASDNVESDFGYVANGDLDTAAIATFLGATTGLITTWYDQSGNGNNATQTTADNQPLYTASGPDFDGSNDYLNTGLATLANNQTASAIVRFSGASSARDSVLGGGTNLLLRPRHDAADHRYFAGSNNLVMAGVLANGVMAIAGREAYLNGASEGTIAAGSAGGTLPAIYLGAWNSGGSALNPSTATLHEVVISSATYTAGQVAAITTIMQGA